MNWRHSTAAPTFVLFFLLAIQSECSNSISMVRRALTSGIRRNFSVDGTKRVNNECTKCVKTAGSVSKMDSIGKVDPISKLYTGESHTNELMHAIESCNRRQLVQLIKSGANLNARDSNGVTPLERTLQLHRHEQLYELVFADANLNLNDLDSFGRGYIHTAIARDQFSMARFLISQGAKISEPNALIQAMVDAARFNEGVQAVRLPLLIDLYLMSGCDRSVLSEVIQKCQKKPDVRPEALKFLKQLINNHSLELNCDEVTTFNYPAIFKNEPLIF